MFTCIYGVLYGSDCLSGDVQSISRGALFACMGILCVCARRLCVLLIESNVVFFLSVQNHHGSALLAHRFCRSSQVIYIQGIWTKSNLRQCFNPSSDGCIFLGLLCRRCRTWMKLSVSFHVQSQMIGPRETPFAVATLEWFGARVLPVVPRQFVASGKPPLASLPRTFVRLFTWNHVKQYD